MTFSDEYRARIVVLQKQREQLSKSNAELQKNIKQLRRINASPQVIESLEFTLTDAVRQDMAMAQTIREAELILRRLEM